MIISHKHKFIFIHVPKTGGSSIKKALEPFLGEKDRIIGLPYSQQSDFTKHETALQIRKKVGERVWKEYFKFAFIRNPWDLVVSNYFFWTDNKDIQNLSPTASRRIRSYRNFKDHVLGEKKFELIGHNSRWISDEKNNLMVDFVGRFENLQQDFDLVCKKIGVPPTKLSINNSTNHKHYCYYYDSETENRVYRMFKTDIERWGYEFDKSLSKMMDELKEVLEEAKIKKAYPVKEIRSMPKQEKSNEIHDKEYIFETAKKPKVSIVTSVYNGDEYICQFLEDITKQTIFDDCELILINANSPGNEEPVIREYMKKFPNIIYHKLSKDPGIYESWSTGIRMAKGEYITNANLDDRRAPEHLRLHAEVLEKNPEIDLVCAPVMVTRKKNETWENNTAHGSWWNDQIDIFGLREMFQKEWKDGKKTGRIIPNNLPHCMPVWRKQLHQKYGYFEEKKYGVIADWVFWLKCLDGGCLFKKLKEPMGLYLKDKESYSERLGDDEITKKIIERYYPQGYARKVNLSKVINSNFGRHHRAGWRYALSSLKPLHFSKGVHLEGFIEKKFCWGNEKGDFKNNPQPHITPWVGFVHNPPNIPPWFQYEQSCQSIINSKLWRDSLKQCRGLFCLSEYHKNWLREHLDVPVENLLHPTEIPEKKFDFEKFSENKNKRIVQIGWWLRKLHSIYFLPTSKLKKTIINLDKQFIYNLIKKEKEVYKLNPDYSSVEIINYLPNDEYDKLLSENIAYLDLYDSSANNTIIECIARNTPILVNPLPAVKEYLGENYPFYFTSREEAARMAENTNLIEEVHKYLKKSQIKKKLTKEYFLGCFMKSDIYKNLDDVTEPLIQIKNEK